MHDGSPGVWAEEPELNLYFEEYFRCPERYVKFALTGRLLPGKGYFRFGSDIVCFGRCAGQNPSASLSNCLPDTIEEVREREGFTYLPFDLKEVVDGLRFEEYASAANNGGKSMKYSALESMYYGVRPVLPVAIRKYLQRVRLNGWDLIPFPHWPVDRSVDQLFDRLMVFALRAQKLERMPFIWFWPEGASSSAIMTHDVETARGRDFCAALMDIDDQYGIKASFQIVPERGYEVTSEYLESITKRGFEVGVQDLKHDGYLFRNRDEFMERAAKINSYGRKWGAEGFRAAVLYRRQEWFDALDFSYDMSVPNVAHLDPQRGGCCTVKPYFVGKLLELPVTATQDYSLFHIMDDYSIDLWKQQIHLIMEEHGLISFIVHPDYIIASQNRETYKNLLSYLSRLREEKNVWISTPSKVNRWWRQRAAMNLVEDNGKLRIEGEGSERARIAYAQERDGKLDITVQSQNTTALVR